jgi:hypothetical protein
LPVSHNFRGQGIRDLRRDPREGERNRATLHDLLSRQDVQVAEVEQSLWAYVAQLKKQGESPERVVVAVKDLLSNPSVPFGQSAQKAFDAARESTRLANALISLAIVQYFDESSTA